MQNVLISACLLGVDCKYNGSNNKLDDDIIHSLKDKYNLIPVCPEIMGGLPTPRNPVEIKDGKVFDYDGEEFTEEFEKGSDEVVKLAKLYNPTIAILKKILHLVEPIIFTMELSTTKKLKEWELLHENFQKNMWDYSTKKI